MDADSRRHSFWYSARHLEGVDSDSRARALVHGALERKTEQESRELLRDLERRDVQILTVPDVREQRADVAVRETGEEAQVTI